MYTTLYRQELNSLIKTDIRANLDSIASCGTVSSVFSSSPNISRNSSRINPATLDTCLWKSSTACNPKKINNFKLDKCFYAYVLLTKDNLDDVN